MQEFQGGERRKVKGREGGVGEEGGEFSVFAVLFNVEKVRKW